MTTGFSTLVAIDLVKHAQAGDRRAHAELFRVYGGAVMTLARRLMGRRDTAEEVLQDTFVEVIRKIGDYRGDAPLGFWVRRIAVNHCLMRLRAEREPHVDVTGMELEGGRDFSGALARADLETLLDRLPPLARTVLWLHDVEGYTHPEIAGLLGQTVSFSKSQLARSHARLRAMVVAEVGVREEVSCTPKSAI